MKTNNYFRKTLLLMALLAGVSTAWADIKPQPIPQDLGDYIVLGSATGNDNFADYVTTHTGCSIDSRLADADNSKFYTIGSTLGGSTATLAIQVKPTQNGNYVFGFKTGSNNGTSKVEITLTKAGSSTVDKIATEEAIIENRDWDPKVNHIFHIGNMEKDEIYTIKLTATKTSGDYCGNFGLFYFHEESQLTWPTSSSYMELSDGTFYNCSDNSDNVINNTGRTGAYIDDLLIYNDTEQDYLFCFNIDSQKQDAKVKITVSDFDSGVQEAQSTIIVLTQGDYKCPLSSKITTGLKKVRFDFLDNDESADDSYLFNFRQVYFESYTYDVLPLKGTATLNLNQTTAKFNNCSYESGESKDNIGNIKGTTPYADNYYVNNTNEEAYYDLFANIPWHKTDGSTLKVTISDVETGAEEATGTSSSIDGTGVIHFALDNAITAGPKKIRFDFVHATVTGDYLYNVKEVSFYKRSLNEGYDYTPVAATGVDVVLTRTLSANKWSTIMLPFNISATDLGTALGTTVTLAQFDNYDSENKQLVFTPADDAIAANTPYMIKVSNDVSGAKTINGVNIVTTGDQYVEKDGVRFQGVYCSTKMDAGDYFVSGNQLYKATASTKAIKPFRAYFKDMPTGARLMFFDETTGISEVMGNTEKASGIYYDLQGRRIAQPQKGLYIVNGKKVVLK